MSVLSKRGITFSNLVSYACFSSSLKYLKLSPCPRVAISIFSLLKSSSSSQVVYIAFIPYEINYDRELYSNLS